MSKFNIGFLVGVGTLLILSLGMPIWNKYLGGGIEKWWDWLEDKLERRNRRDN